MSLRSNYAPRLRDSASAKQSWARLVGVATMAAAFAAACGARADDIDDVLAAKVCPEDRTPYDKITYEKFCLGLNGDACSINDAGCFDDVRRCWDQVNQLNKKIFAYNLFVASCKPPKPTKSDVATKKK